MTYLPRGIPNSGDSFCSKHCERAPGLLNPIRCSLFGVLQSGACARLAADRLALNFLQTLSSIAATAQHSAEVIRGQPESKRLRSC